MTDAFHIRLMRPVPGVAVGEDAATPAAPDAGNAAAASCATERSGSTDAQRLADLERQQGALQQTQGVLQDLVHKLTQLQEELLSTHRREIARLAVEIARKVLMQEVRDGDYQIEQIIQEALKNAPVRQNVVVHLHPEDLHACQALLEADPEGPLARLTLRADTSIGRAECLIETPKGVVKSFIENHLDKIREALERAN